jgi:hypothetical protein
MTIIETDRSTLPILDLGVEFAPVAFDLYRDIHKGIRAELFALTGEAGSADPNDATALAAVAEHLRSVVHLLESHAEHEDTAMAPTLEVELPDLAARIAAEHVAIDARLAVLSELASDAVFAPRAQRRDRAFHTYRELAAFTSAYLAHQDVEERLVMPALEERIGVEAVMGIHGAIIGAIPPDEMAASLAVMLPAMNLEDRTELLGGMQASAPAEVFAGVWSLAGSVLAPNDVDALAIRLGVTG